MSVLLEVESRVTAPPDDGYMQLVNDELSNLPNKDRELFRAESRFAASLYGTYGAKADDDSFCEQKIMEHFAKEEALRMQPVLQQ